MTQADQEFNLPVSILGNSPSVSAIRDKIRHLSSFDTVGGAHVPTTLIVGETGTGKGLVARAIHESGPRAQGPFIDVNCAAIPENLLEAELFGFEAGAFTDAKRTKQGLFEAASKGTLFLDEVDALAIQLQAKLLKAIEEKRIRRLGALSDQPVDVKIIAATQRDLSGAVAEGRFRADLFHRLAVVVLELPPLRERGDDILLLANHYLSRFAEAHGQLPQALTEDATAWLMAYTWPGNIRELNHMMERVTLLQFKRPVDAALLKELCTAGKAVFGSAAETRSDDGRAQDSAEIRKALASTGGNVVRAARVLGLSRNALRYRMRRYGIDRPTLECEEAPGDFVSATTTGAQTSLPSDAREGGKPPPKIVSEPLATANLPAFVGRKKEMEFLQLALQDAIDGHGCILCISGPAGIGKTRLVRELRRTTQNQTCLWLEGCFNRAGNHPYQAWVQVLRKCLDQQHRLSLPKITSSRSAQLAKLVPEFHKEAAAARIDLSCDPETERIRLFDSLTGFLSELSRKIPIVIFLDDLHWAPSIDYLHYLARNIEDLKVLVLATYRPDELRDNVNLWKSVMALMREQSFQSLTLNPFDRRDIERLALSRIGGAVAPELVEMFHQKTQGNPFFIEELLQLLQQEKAIIPGHGGWTIQESVSPKTPDSVKAVVYERLELLGKEVENFLTLASVMGGEFAPQLLQSLVTDSEDNLTDLLDRSETAGIIVAQDIAGEEKYSFAHDLIQEALYESLGTAKKRQLHRHIGFQMEQRYAAKIDDHCEALAHHFLVGNAFERALHYAMKAGEKAERTSSWEQAAKHFESVLALMQRGTPNAHQKAYLLERLGDLQALLGRPNLDQLQQALEVFRDIGQTEKACRMHRLIGIAWTSGTAGRVDLEKAIENFQSAAALVQAEPDTIEKAFAHSYVAFGLLRGRLDLAKAQSESEKAAKMAEDIGDNDIRARAYTEIGVVRAFLGDLKSAEEYAEKSWQAATNSKDPWMSARASLYPITFWPWRNERRWLERWVGRAMEYRKSSAVTRYDLAIYSLAALLKALMGEPEEAGEALARAEDAGRARAYFTPYWLHYPAAAYAVLGEWQRAKELFAQGLRTSREGRLQSNVPEVGRYARLLLSMDDIDEAKDVIFTGYELARDKGSRVQQLALLSIRVELNVRCGSLGRAEEDLVQAKALLSQLDDWKGMMAPVFTAEGVLRVSQENWELAEQAFYSARESEHTHGFAYGEAGILAKWAEVYRRRSKAEDRGRAERLLSEALNIYERCSAKMDIVRTKEALGS